MFIQAPCFCIHFYLLIVQDKMRQCLFQVKDHVLRRRHPDLHRLLSFASKVVVPQKSRREAVNIKVEEFRCCPPPLLFILLSLVEVKVPLS